MNSQHPTLHAVAASAVLFLAGCASSGGPTDRNVLLPGNAVEVRVERKMRDRPIAFVEELLIGEPGVRVSGNQVRIRGNLQGPLWIIDGIYLDSAAGLDPHEVERMWINASGHGYGRRGANGVVIVMTKSR